MRAEQRIPEIFAQLILANRKWIIVRIDGKTVDIIKGRSHKGQRPLYGKSDALPDRREVALGMCGESIQNDVRHQFSAR